MSGWLLRISVAVLAVMALSACGKNGGNSPAPGPGAAAKSYGKEDGECFAGIVRAADAKHMSSADFGKWEGRLNDKDKIWIAGFSGYHAYLSKILTSHLGKTNKELVDAKVITEEQGSVIDGYVQVAQDDDAARANSLAAGACSSIGFSKGLDLN